MGVAVVHIKISAGDTPPVRLRLLDPMTGQGVNWNDYDVSWLISPTPTSDDPDPAPIITKSKANGGLVINSSDPSIVDVLWTVTDTQGLRGEHVHEAVASQGTVFRKMFGTGRFTVKRNPL